MMNREYVKRELKDIIITFVQNMGETSIELNDEDILVGEEYGIDSVTMVQIIVEIERRFDIEVDDEYLTMDFLSSINALADFVIKLLEGNL